MSKTIKHWHFKGLLQKDKWYIPAYLGTDITGRITYISDQKLEAVKTDEYVDGYAIPAFQNAHAHAFQYAMAGTAERHTTADDFWSWREKMYSLALNISPEELEAIAAMLYSEMLRHGYTQVAEFHYLHHDLEGRPYSNLAEMGARLVAAAAQVGIGITLIPVFYQKGGFGQAASPRQRRFLSATSDDYLRLWEATQEVCKSYDRAKMGVGIHSLRAVDQAHLLRSLAQVPPQFPIHIHVAEQLKEISDSLAFYGQRPVEWLLNHVELSSHWQLVHATHLTDAEVSGIAQSAAQVVICPSTEGNLGDGRFRLKEFQSQGGKWCIGTDSHIGLSPMEELRILDYGQRIHLHQRNIFHSSTQTDSGLYGFQQALQAGRRAMGHQQADYFEMGHAFDAVVIDAKSPLIASSKVEHILSTLIYAGDPSFLLGTLTAGKWKVKDQHHIDEQSIRTRFYVSIKDLGNR